MIRFRHTWLTSILVLATTAAAVAQDSIPWITDLAEARKLAEQQQRLVLLHFWGDGCQPCQQLESTVFNQPELIRVLSTNFVPVKIHVQQQPNIASYYKIEKIPTDIIVMPNGVQVFRTTSPANVNTYIAMLDQVRANALANGFKQIDQVSKNLSQIASSLPALTANPSDASNESAPTLQSTLSQAWRSLPAGASVSSGAPGAPAIPAPTSVSNEFVGPLDQSQSQPNRPEPQANNTATPSRYGNPYLNDQVASESANPTESSNAAEATAPTGPHAVSQSLAQNTSTGEAQPSRFQTAASSGSNDSAQQQAHQNTFGGPTGSPSNAAPPQAANLGNQTWNPSQSQPTTAPAGTQVAGGVAPAAPANRNLPQLPPGVPPLALDGHCPVTLMNLGKWEKGDPRFGVVHRDRTYLFKSQIERDRFLAPAAADRFAPVLSGLDPVRFAETGQAVDGRREHGVLFDGQIYLFADEDALVRFEQQPQRYVAVVRQAMANARNVPPQR